MGHAPTPVRHTVLVVDDDAIIRLELVDMLEEQGFTVLDVADADEAIAVLEARDDIVAVLTDVQMPGSMDGIRLAHVVRNRWPPVVLFVLSAQMLGDDRTLPERSSFYGKPIDSRRLLRDLSVALAR